MLPKFSMAWSCLTITCFWAIRMAPRASVTVMIMGRNSGVRPTASARENMKASAGSRLSRASTKKTNSTRAMTTRRIIAEKPASPRSNSVCGG
ncbi:hypothetical protein D3C86_1129350 [compost metagenome]